jgi:PAS domain S-box-containing protein
VAETFFEELKRYVHFGLDDEDALRWLEPLAGPWFPRIVDRLIDRAREHAELGTLVGSDPRGALAAAIADWLAPLCRGPWDEAYAAERARVGRALLRRGASPRLLVAAVDVVRLALVEVAGSAAVDRPDRRARAETALHKLLDLELALVLESDRDEREARLPAHEGRPDEARYDQIVEEAEALITTIDADGRVRLVNARCEQAIGVPRAQAVGSSWLELFAHPGDRRRAHDRQEDARAGRVAPTFEGPLPRPGEDDDRRIRWHFTVLPGGGTAALLCAIGFDVTEEYNLALRTRRAERLASLGTMAAGLAHEIRNPINAAHLQLNLARRRLTRAGGEPSVIRAIELADSEMTRLAVLVEDFLRFARPQPLRLATGDLRATADATVALVGPEAEALGVAVAIAAGEPVWAEFDDEKIKQVLLNLLRNAIEATEPGGSVAVRVARRDQVACLDVTDEGPGVPSGAPIFEPFFTTKEQGTGLGLAIVHRIVSDHGGGVEVATSPEGTTFSIWFPLGRTRPPGTATALSRDRAAD